MHLKCETAMHNLINNVILCCHNLYSIYIAYITRFVYVCGISDLVTEKLEWI